MIPPPPPPPMESTPLPPLAMMEPAPDKVPTVSQMLPPEPPPTPKIEPLPPLAEMVPSTCSVPVTVSESRRHQNRRDKSNNFRRRYRSWQVTLENHKWFHPGHNFRCCLRHSRRDPLRCTDKWAGCWRIVRRRVPDPRDSPKRP